MKIVFTSAGEDEFCKCQFCEKILAVFKNDIMVPSAEEAAQKGNIPVPNFGWFCSEKCASDYELKCDIRFDRTKEGKIGYH